jgi:hypothetical protein
MVGSMRWYEGDDTGGRWWVVGSIDVAMLEGGGVAGGVV